MSEKSSEKKFRKRFAGHDLDRRRGHAVSVGAGLGGWLAARGMKPEQPLLDQLWKNWELVMGPDIAPLACPIGHRNGILIVGGEDSYALQELSYAVPEILMRANAFMDALFFHKVELHLLMGKEDLRSVGVTPVPPPPRLQRPPRLGRLNLPADSPAAAAYAAYVRMFEEEE